MSKSIAGTSAKADQVIQRMRAVKIFEKDIQEEFVASPGPGGQNVNKTATCVVLKYLPTNEIIKSHQYRTQLANRIRARELLVQRVEFRQQAQQQQAAETRAKERARNRKRSFKSKEKMLEEKRQQSQRKQSRKNIARTEY